jgi:tellurite resistance protein TehA-like permease
MARKPTKRTGPLTSPGVLRAAVMDLSPAYFAMVMATGIVSLAAHMMGLPTIAAALFGLNVAVYTVMWLLTILRIVWFRDLVLRDLVDHQRGPGFFTAVAASCILGGEFVLLASSYYIALVLWSLGITLWVQLTYTILAAFTTAPRPPAV